MAEARILTELLDEAEQQLEVAQGQHDIKGGLLTCDCPCHLTIEQGGAKQGDCIHCRVLG